MKKLLSISPARTIVGFTGFFILGILLELMNDNNIGVRDFLRAIIYSIVTTVFVAAIDQYFHKKPKDDKKA